MKIDIVVRFFYPTCDDWSPNFPRNTVEFKLYVYENGMIRIHVRGADDTAMEKDEYVEKIHLEKRINEIRHWLEYKIPNPVSMEWLSQQGFQRC